MISAVDGLPEVSFVTDEPGLGEVEDRLTRFLARSVDDADADGVVVAMSGGVDSSLTAALCTEALGRDSVSGLLLPCHKHEAVATADGRMVAEEFGIETETVSLRPVVDAFEDSVAPAFGTPDDRARGNAVARLRMAAVYYAANRTDRLVCGTSNRTELLLGYFTKHGDGAADLRPLAPLYKTEVRALARHVGLPDEVVDKPSTAGFTADQTDEGDLGAPYGLLDVVLHRLTEGDLGVEGVADELGIDPELVREYAAMHAASAHKRDPPRAPDFGRDQSGERFHELESRFD